MELIIGDKVWSTWSMRPWLVLRQAGVPFTESLVRLRAQSSPTTGDAALAAGSPSRMVPALKDGDLVIWDSLAICEYLAERFPQAALWPADPMARALGRSAVAEMHSGFVALRQECPMDLSQTFSVTLSPEAEANLRRICRLWGELLNRFGGPFLLGQWSIADAYYTPVATRIRGYDLPVDDVTQAYVGRLLAVPAFLQWEREAIESRASVSQPV